MAQAAAEDRGRVRRGHGRGYLPAAQSRHAAMGEPLPVHSAASSGVSS